ncbi:hypothetical protein NBH19_07660 [Rhizobium sp. S95]|uniref:Uncharacterized protein n=1 Tax=Ciceribacter sichuanensis TaxID=2949647 RepID=A0AAJ1C0X8_9HYPH|nr:MULTISPECIES: hypothetical protein [unclassified Ciceribacter]MCM2395959.1 hypothetical protein [Ciceribacter sp. S95]MCO5959627.1 hypothetical protein [Ciceribacter sp. S101]
MRTSLLSLGLLLLMAPGAFAKEPFTEIFLSTDKISHEVAGTITHDTTRSFVYRSAADGDITVKVAAENAICGFEIKRSSAPGFQPDISSFPASRVFSAKRGETFILSFFQSRTAWTEKKECLYSLSIS